MGRRDRVGLCHMERDMGQPGHVDGHWNILGYLEEETGFTEKDAMTDWLCTERSGTACAMTKEWRQPGLCAVRETWGSLGYV